MLLGILKWGAGCVRDADGGDPLVKRGQRGLFREHIYPHGIRRRADAAGVSERRGWPVASGLKTTAMSM